MAPSLPTLLARLKESEGWRSHVYLDTTGHLTIGWGHNLGKLVLPPGVDYDDVKIVPVNGITMTIGEALLVGDVLDVIASLRTRIPWFDRLDEPRQQCLSDLAFNMGVTKLIEGWPNFLEDVRQGRYDEAAETLRGSKWARQVGRRAEPLIQMMESGRK